MPNLLNPRSFLPEIKVPLVSGGIYNSNDAAPENFQITLIYRGYHCPKCKKQLETINDMMADIQADGHDLIAISMDSEERAKKTKEEWAIENIDIGYDLSILQAKSLGLFLSNAISKAEPDHFAEPALFVTRSDGTIYAEIIQNTPFGRPDFKDLISGLNYAVQNDYPVRGTSTV